MYDGFGGSSSSSLLPPPYPGSAAGQHISSKSQTQVPQASQHQKQQSSMGSMSRSIFDSPEKAPRPENPPPPLGPIHDLIPGSFDPMLPTPPVYPNPHQPPSPPSLTLMSMPILVSPEPEPSRKRTGKDLKLICNKKPKIGCDKIEDNNNSPGT